MGEAQTESSNPDWEENVVIQGDSETLHEYGIQKRNDGQKDFRVPRNFDGCPG